jgi:hypothetical protein
MLSSPFQIITKFSKQSKYTSKSLLFFFSSSFFLIFFNLLHVGIIDKEAHYGVNSEASEQYLFDLFASSGLREFIDTHPDYLLILSSDHGRSKKGKFHGEGTTTMSGNIGMVTFYNPIFHGQNMSGTYFFPFSLLLASLPL